MSLLEHIPIPRRLRARIWLLSVPSALLSFERRQRLPRLPRGRWRLLGLPLLGAGAALWVWATRRPPHPLSLEAPTRWTDKPGTIGGILALAGVSLLLRSLLLALYTVGIALAWGLNLIALEEPHPGHGQGRPFQQEEPQV